MKLEVLEIVSTVKGHEDWVKAMDLSENKGRAGIVKIMDLTHLLGENYQKQRWYKLLPVALAELRNEGYHELLGLPATAKISYQQLLEAQLIDTNELTLRGDDLSSFRENDETTGEIVKIG